MLDYKLGDYLPVHEFGHVALIDKMGNDEAVVDAARISYDRRGRTEDRGLIRYLLRHRHCYHPSMEVLTLDGWKQWDECGTTEIFMVPDPEKKVLTPQNCCVNIFEVNEELITFNNDRMSYCVTSDHRMWFKGKYQQNFSIIRAHDMSSWGHFDPLIGYSYVPKDTSPDPLGQFVGFILGDGSWAGNGICFHLRKERKKKYLREILYHLGYEATESPSATYEDAIAFYIKVKDVYESGVLEYLTPGERAEDKKINKIPEEKAMLIGVLDGLVNSDGSIKKDRPGQIQYSSKSNHLLKLFEVLSAFCGMDAHTSHISKTAYNNQSRTSLESRKEYFGYEQYSGSVYCATTDSGLLIVRGGPDKYGFVCGNTSPFEMAVLKFEVKMPIFVARQWVRHRTASLNEVSARYTELPEEMFIPKEFSIQATDNKQGRGDILDEDLQEMLREAMGMSNRMSYSYYQSLLDSGVARETAREVLNLNIYTKFIWKMDLHNLMHFLNLRLDPHAQKEIRDYAEVIEKLVALFFPLTYEAFVDYIRDAYMCSRMEIELIRSILVPPTTGMERVDKTAQRLVGMVSEQVVPARAKDLGMSEREIADFRKRFFE